MIDVSGSAELARVLSFSSKYHCPARIFMWVFVSVLLIDLDRSKDDIKLWILIQIHVHMKLSLGCGRVIWLAEFRKCDISLDSSLFTYANISIFQLNVSLHTEIIPIRVCNTYYKSYLLFAKEQRVGSGAIPGVRGWWFLWFMWRNNWHAILENEIWIINHQNTQKWAAAKLKLVFLIISCCVNINGANRPKTINVCTGIEARKVVAVIIMVKITIRHVFLVAKTGIFIEQLFLTSAWRS